MTNLKKPKSSTKSAQAPSPSKQITTTSLVEQFHIDLRTRWIIAITSFIVAIPIVVTGLLIWVAYINNWNFLCWME